MSEPVRIYNAAGFGTAVRHFREEAGLTQEQLADRLGIQRRYIGRLETGITTEQLERLVVVLKELGARITIDKADW